MKTKTRVKFLAIGFTICFIFYGCGGLSKSYPAFSIDKQVAFSPGKKSDPFRLVVGINENGGLRLNGIEVGTIAEPDVLYEKIKSVFDDRARNGISEKEILIQQTGAVKSEDLDRLIETLAKLKASPIRIIREN